jgi:hypothetical protein
MKAIDKFGGWILDTRAGMVFALIVVISGLSIVAYKAFTAPKSVMLTASEFVCVDAEPFGISTRCVAYRRVR